MQSGQSILTIIGTNAERLAIGANELLPLTQFLESDLNNRYEWQGSSWKQISTSGVALVSEAVAGTQFASGTLTDGTLRTVVMANSKLGATVWTVPANGDTVTVKYSLDGGITYDAWPKGAVTGGATPATFSDARTAACTHISFQRTTGAGTTSTYGVTQ